MLFKNDEIILTFITIVGLLVILIFMVISFAFLFQSRQIKHRQEKAILKAQYEKEILQSQIEMQNSTLKYIGQELHDNIGQLLSVAKINMGVMEESIEERNLEEFSFNFHQANDLISEIISEVRGLTKSLDDSFVQEFGLAESIAHELQRIQKTKRFATDLTIQGDKYILGYEREIILFRIVQEILNNTLKHSGAKNITIILKYYTKKFVLVVSDDGRGFNYESTIDRDLSQAGAGLRNINRRAALIHFDCELMTQKDIGTKFTLTTTRISSENQ